MGDQNEANAQEEESVKVAVMEKESSAQTPVLNPGPIAIQVYKM